jgi:hypothetical protein
MLHQDDYLDVDFPPDPDFKLAFNFFINGFSPITWNPNFQPLARIKSPSYASGHKLWAFTETYIFSEIIHEKREEFLQRADEVRWSRELLAIHYPSDNAPGFPSTQHWG